MHWGQVWGSPIWDLDSWWVSSCGVTAARVSLLLLTVGAAGHRESLEGQIRVSVLSPGLTSAFCILHPLAKTPAVSLSRWSRTWDTGLSEPLLPAKPGAPSLRGLNPAILPSLLGLQSLWALSAMLCRGKWVLPFHFWRKAVAVSCARCY